MVFTLDSGSESPGVTPNQEIYWLNSWHVGFCVERCRLKTRLSHCVVFWTLLSQCMSLYLGVYTVYSHICMGTRVLSGKLGNTGGGKGE